MPASAQNRPRTRRKEVGGVKPSSLHVGAHPQLHHSSAEKFGAHFGAHLNNKRPLLAAIGKVAKANGSRMNIG